MDLQDFVQDPNYTGHSYSETSSNVNYSGRRGGMATTITRAPPGTTLNKGVPIRNLPVAPGKINDLFRRDK